MIESILAFLGVSQEIPQMKFLKSYKTTLLQMFKGSFVFILLRIPLERDNKMVFIGILFCLQKEQNSLNKMEEILQKCRQI